MVPPWLCHPSAERPLRLNPNRGRMVEESLRGGHHGSGRVLRGAPRPPAAPSPVAVVSRRLWSVERAGKGWRLERAVGVDCSLPEPRCIWLSSLRWHAAGTAPPCPPAPRRGRSSPRTDKCHLVSTACRGGGGVGVEPWVLGGMLRRGGQEMGGVPQGRGCWGWHSSLCLLPWLGLGSKVGGLGACLPRWWPRREGW